MAEDATVWTDGGGKVRGAALRAVQGSEAIARFLGGLVARVPLPADQSYAIHLINGWPAIVGRSRGTVNSITTIETDGERILSVHNVVNPDKLRLVAIN